MTKYEIMYILSTQVTEDDRKGSVAFVEELLTKNGATELSTELMGEKKLAYPINKKDFGFYVLTKFSIDGKNLAEIEKRLNIYEDLMKYMIVKNEK